MNWHLSMKSTVHQLCVKKILIYCLEPSPGCQLILAYKGVTDRLSSRVCSHAENSSKTSQSGFVSQQDTCYKSDFLHSEAGKKGKVE